jgi:hypothetical protein
LACFDDAATMARFVILEDVTYHVFHGITSDYFERPKENHEPQLSGLLFKFQKREALPFVNTANVLPLT